MRSAWVGVAVAALGGAVTNPALAQRVRGTLTDSATHEPIPGAVVVVSDSAGTFLSRGVAGANGRFDVPRLVGSRRVHVVRIGYRPVDAVLGDGDEPLALEMRAVASQLATVTTAGRRVCPGETGNSRALQLWEQARAGFFASVVAREARAPTIRLHFFRVARDPVLKRVDDDSSWYKDAVGDQSFVAARSASAFASEGYMRERESGEREFFAPDEAALLDPAFAGSHCLRVVPPDAAHAREVGIAFEPVQADRDTLVDIRGAVWLDARSLELRTLEFDYTNLEHVTGGSGGSVTFQTMPTGVPMIVRWMIHSPVLATDVPASSTGRRRTLAPRPARTEFRVLGYLETGGETRAVRWPAPDSATWLPRLPAVTGIVVDPHGQRIPRARVWMYGIADTVTTDSMGVFRLPRPIGGFFNLVASDSVLAAASINRSVPLGVRVAEDPHPTGDIDVDAIVMYPRAAALKSACPAGRFTPGLAVAVIRVVSDSGLAVANAHIDVETLQAVVAGDTVARPVHREGLSGPDGRFMVCGAAPDQPMAFKATFGDAHGEAGIARWTDEVMLLTIRLHRGAD